MASEEKKSELKRHRDIVLATIDYLEKTDSSVKFDQFDPNADYYQYQKQKTEEDFQKRKLEKLQKTLLDMTELALFRGDLHLEEYIKERTGYDIDIFKNFQSRVDKIIDQRSIKNEKEYHDAIRMTHPSPQTRSSRDRNDLLNKLFNEYQDRKSKRRGNSDQVIVTRVDLNSLTEIYSPDNKRKIMVAETIADSDNPQTDVFIDFGKDSGLLYAVNGTSLDIKTYWKDNNTIIIETKKEYLAITKYKQAQSLQDIVTIDYLES